MPATATTTMGSMPKQAPSMQGPSSATSTIAAPHMSTLPMGIDPATATTLILGMHRHMKPATLLSLLPYAYPAALASLVDILQKDAAASALSADGAAEDAKPAGDANSHHAAYLQALAQSPVYAMAASLSTALLDSSLRPLKQHDVVDPDVDPTAKPQQQQQADTVAPSAGKEKRARQKRLARWTCAPDKELKLTGDMLILYQALLPSMESVERRHRFVAKLQHIFNVEWPNRGAVVQLFGDVDICLMSSWSGFKNVYTMAEGLRKWAKVPIVKLWDPEL
ncbi:hypothetical protein SYNPS1DRAFT_23206 [Syncephalis pseudoplumigaleata]|uniref:Uncharacterized protein n=1 Tax=Syncephalis pseudoplumigaleata TaxID=1712513 RepID=A0A4P9YXD3_9FUNG|nr:hypothetical protein SYNPS1DRAFT_23206 [Syncephalis pseudoplumigaleata]|eukprot:RKP24736.1 hypothetical protein SYNPS1DRAFT_23206 [Syncephalis pseudoplumigaleata]